MPCRKPFLRVFQSGPHWVSQGFLAQESARLIFCLGCSTWIMIPRLRFFKPIYKNMKVFLKTCGCVTGRRGKREIFREEMLQTFPLFKLPWAPFLMNRNGTLTLHLLRSKMAGNMFHVGDFIPCSVKLKINESIIWFILIELLSGINW